MNVLNLHEDPHIANFLAFNEMKEALMEDHSGKWVVIYNLELQGTYESRSEAQQAAIEAGFDYLSCCIRQVGAEPLPLILLGL
ncbi:MAG: hypothetical protein F4X65_06755 [Chloroflexi bacterium]|nr:hypothetical protein [Chloroflexota bacterium]